MPLVALFAGIFVYVSSRAPARLTAFRFLETRGLDVSLAPVLRIVQSVFPSIPAWLSSWLVDGLWSYALVGCIVWLWREKPFRDGAPWIALSFSMGPLWEAGQYFGWIRGTFDIADVAATFVGGAVALLHYIQKGDRRGREESSSKCAVAPRYRLVRNARCR